MTLRLRRGSDVVAPIAAKTTIGGLREIVSATHQAHHVVRFDHVIWLATRMYDLLREIDAIELSGAPIERYVEAQQTLIANMDALMAKTKGPLLDEFDRLLKENAKKTEEIVELRIRNDTQGGRIKELCDIIDELSIENEVFSKLNADLMSELHGGDHEPVSESSVS
jgi:hypothetical protein